MQIHDMTSDWLKKTLPLIAEYQRFYGAAPVSAKNWEHFSQVLADPSLGVQFVVIDASGMAAGFATLYFPMSSLKPGRSALMNDLFVLPNFRGQGLGRALIDRCLAYAHEKGHESIEWQTQLSNKDAQELYNRMDARKSAWFHYEMKAVKAGSTEA